VEEFDKEDKKDGAAKIVDARRKRGKKAPILKQLWPRQTTFMVEAWLQGIVATP